MKYLPTKLIALSNLISRLLSVSFFVFFLSLSPTFAQLNQVAQIEIPRNTKLQERISVLPLGNEGMLMTIERDVYYSRDEPQWTFYRYDTNFKEIWNNTFRIDDEFVFQQSFKNKHYLFWLFAVPQTTKINIVRIDFERGEIDEFKGDLLSEIDITSFKVLSNTAFIGGLFFEKPVINSFSFFNLKSKVLHGLFSNNQEISSLEVDENHAEFHVFVKERIKGKCGLALQTYSTEGKSLRTIHLPENPESNTFMNGKMLPLNENETFLVGNFANNCSEYAKGLYLTQLENGVEKNTSLINFSDLKNFFSYMSPKRQERIKEKIEQKKREGKDPNLSYKLLAHDLITTEKGAVLVAEIYYTFSRNPSNYYTINSARPNRRELQEDYRFTHTVICEFNKEGKILWDNSVVMDNLESLDLIQQVQVSQLQNRWLLAYLKKGRVFIQEVQDGELLGEKEEYEIKIDSTTSRPDEDANVAAWYEQNFLVWGVKKEESKQSEDYLKEVFYIRKLNYSSSNKSKNPK